VTRTGFISLKPDQWPPSDLALWQAAQMADDPLDVPGLAAGWRPDTLSNVERAWGMYLAWLAATGRLEPQARPVDRIRHSGFAAFLDAYAEGHAESSLAAMMRAIYDFVRACCPDADVAWLRRKAGKAQRRAKHVKPPAQRRRPATELAEIGETLMARGVEMLPTLPATGAITFRNGLIFALEVTVPLRVKNLAALRVGYTLLRDETSWRVSFPTGAMKNHRPFEAWYPERLTETIDYYLADIRPRLPTPPTNTDEGWMWPGRRGGPMWTHAITRIVREINRAHSGVPLPTHGFRHSVTTEIAIADPGHFGIASSVLGHASAQSKEAYNLAAAYESQARFLDLLDALRRGDAGA
jgi:integrase